MKKKSTSKSAFFNLRILTASVFCLSASLWRCSPREIAQSQTNKPIAPMPDQDAPGTQTPDVVQMVGPVLLNQDLRNLPYVAPKEEFDEQPLTRYPHGTGQTGTPPDSRASASRTVATADQKYLAADAHDAGAAADL